MNLAAFRTTLLLLTGCILSVASHASTENITKSVVQILVEFSVPDLDQPWNMGPTGSTHGSGVIIEGNRILTAAHVIDNAITIRIRKVGSNKHVPAVIEYISDGVDLAILTVNEKGFFEGTVALPVGTLPELGEDIVAWGFPVGGDGLAITKGIVSRVDFDMYSHSFHSNLVVQVDAAINGGASGGPAVIGREIAGINFQARDELDNAGYIVPAPVIHQFINDIKDGKVDGVPYLALYRQDMGNEQLRRWQNMDDGQSGVLVTQLSGFEKEKSIFHAGDVILEVDGAIVGNDGTVKFISGDRIAFEYLLAQKQIGETVKFKVKRRGKVKELSYPLTYNLQESGLVDGHYSGFVADYIAIGGVVFQELSLDYMSMVWEDEQAQPWMDKAVEKHKSKGFGQEDKLVFVASILADEINYGYDAFLYEKVETINDVTVTSIDTLRKFRDSNKDKYIRIGFTDNEMMVFDTDDLKIREPVIKEASGL